jgi:CHASE2 domain-containing sensor protein
LAEHSSENKPATAKGSGLSGGWWDLVRPIGKRSAISILLLVAAWNISVSSNFLTRTFERPGACYETGRAIRDINLHLQLRFYQLLLTHGRPIPLKPDHVSLAIIDDDTHWTALYGDEPTSRAYLAKLIRNASRTKTKAAAIGLDVELLAPRNFPEGSDAQTRYADNQELLKAIWFATEQGVPVILGGIYYVDKERQYHDLPNIYTEQELLGPENPQCSSCPAFGYLNLPDDKRQIPLQQYLQLSDEANHEVVDSFALSLAKAVRGLQDLQRDSVLSGKPILGSFLPADEYRSIFVPNLANGESTAEQACAGRIVLIGGYWHDIQGYGAPVDQHLSPAGYMSGIVLHANYVESLLQHQWTREIPAYIDIILDLLIGCVVYICFEASRKLRWKLAVLACTFFIPILCAYLFLDLWNRYLDFLLPIELYFLHILYEFVRNHFTVESRERVDLKAELPGKV